MTDERTDVALGIYLNDHLAGATAGVELARRVAGAERTDGTALAGLATEIAADRDALRDIMAALEVPVRRYKVWLGWVGEKAGRLKPNGRLVGRAPLSRVLELELLRLGVEGKALGWRTLRARADSDSRLDGERLDGLIDRAREQSETLEALRVRAAADALMAPAPFERRPSNEDGGGPR
jgi:hypothetical protein